MISFFEKHKVLQKCKIRYCKIYDNINDHYIDLSESINSNKFINYDITLPHIKSDNIKCPNSECISITDEKQSDIIYIKYDKDNMKYIYSCNHCGQKWTNNWINNSI